LRKKELSKTKVTVRLRKVEDRKEWYLYLESYPVFIADKKQPQRLREYLNRSVSTVEWGKKRAAQTEADGTKTYKPKRDDIVCANCLCYFSDSNFGAYGCRLNGL